ncbi:E3 ubiquitin-protein ligase TRIM21 [Kryptolebias marmoratus]|uniref:E3 ubiquitin-protein ligase TRIM21 n=1 Tax=Kryptolebias marmoratus TaxID=37003 RepID=UPI0007F8880E|nr:E3 ubiquitin-protein ligase TRIM21 [Kryptolebias marmoratus]
MTAAHCQFLCSVCQEVFTDPVSTPCGHNFCKGCVVENVFVDSPFQCPDCLKMFYPRPELQVNTLIADMVHEHKRTADTRGAMKTGIFCVMWICFLVLSFQINPSLPLTEESGENKLEKLEESIEGMIWDLRLNIEEVKRLVLIGREDVWTSKIPEDELQLHISAQQMEQMFTDVMKKEIPQLLLRAELMRVRRYAVDVTLDPDTAHPGLVLSPDGRQVTCCESNLYLPDKPKRFTFNLFVLAKQKFSSGRFYFEVQVEGKTDWTLGVAKESFSRKTDTTLRPQSGFWSISLRNRTEFRGLSDPPVHLPLRSGPQKVGVFVDYEEGLVFFYDINSAAFVFSFTGVFFTERLFPFFDPGRNDDGRNSAPLIISPISQTE